MVERAIVNFGVYQFSEETRQQRIVRLTSQVERQPDNRYSNLKLQKERSFYGWAQLMIGDWVAETIELVYGFQLLLDWENLTDQHQLFHYCTQLNTATNADRVVTALGGTPGPIDPEEPILITPMPYDRMVFKLYSNATLLIEETTEPFINPCLAPIEFDDAPPLSEPSSTDVPANPLDPPYDIPSPPYDEPTADNGETYNPTRPPNENGNPGEVYAWFWRGRILLASEGPPGRFYQNTVAVTAPYSDPQNVFNQGGPPIYQSRRFVNTPAGEVAVIVQDSGSPSDVIAFNAEVETFTLAP